MTRTPATEKTMSKRSILTLMALTAVLAGLVPVTAMAAAQRTFVASNGSDAAVCSLAFPCRTFDVAIVADLAQWRGDRTRLGRLRRGDDHAAGVDHRATGDLCRCLGVSGVGITVNAGAGKVTLRGLTISNISGTTGISYQSGDALYVDNVVVTNFPTAGLSANVGANGSLFVTNSTFHDNGTGALLNATAGTLTVSIDHTLFARNGVGADFRDATAGTIHDSTLSGNTTGLSAAPTTGAKTSKLEVRDCTIADNSGVGVAVGSGVAAPVLVSLVSSLISGNVTGVQVTGVANSAYVSDSTITRNTTGLVYVTSGTAVSGIDNRLINNTSNGAFSSSVAEAVAPRRAIRRYAVRHPVAKLPATSSRAISCSSPASLRARNPCAPGRTHSTGAHPPPPLFGCAVANGSSRAISAATARDRSWPILLKNSIRVLSATILGVSNHHPINLRGSERVLEGRLFRGHSTPPLETSFSTE